MKQETKNKIKTGIERFEWKATSDREAIAFSAARILRQREYAKKLTNFRIWAIMVLFNLLIAILPISAIIKGDYDPVLWGMMALLFIYVDTVLCIFMFSLKMSLDPKFDWAEGYRELIEERIKLRKHEHDLGLPRSKF